MPNAKYQIFVSATYEDLKKERDQVIKVCLEMGHIPVGMEMFNASDEEQWEIIKRCIDESDYYVVIIAHRYGSTVDGVSYTEREYDYAVAQCVPVLGFIINKDVSWRPNFCDSGPDRKKLDAFKAKVKLKLVDFWTSEQDLHAKCAVALGKIFNTRPRPGWVPATSVTGPEVTTELTRLSRENKSLRDRLEELQHVPDTSRFEQDQDTLCITIFGLNEDNGTEERQCPVWTTWGQLFVEVAKAILASHDERSILNSIVNSFDLPVWISVMNSNHSGIEDQTLTMIKTQFLALGLVTFEKGEWNLTAHGQAHFVELTAVRRPLATSNGVQA